MLELAGLDQCDDASSGASASGDGASGASSGTSSGGTRKTAKYWTEVFFTSCGVGDFSYSVFRMAHADLNASMIVDMVFTVVNALWWYSFEAVMALCDGASEHRSFQKECANISIADVRAALDPDLGWGCADLLDTYVAPVGHDGLETINPRDLKGSLGVAFKHPITGRPVFLMSDPVHLIKKLLSSLDKSKKKGAGGDDDEDSARATTRSITKYLPISGPPTKGGAFPIGAIECPLSLRQCRDTWRSRSAASSSHSLTHDKFTEAHFAPDASTRMRVRPAAQVLSATMARYLSEGGHEYNIALAEYCERVNE